MRGIYRAVGVVAASALALTLSACGGDDSGDDSEAGLTVFGCNPENPLVPQNTAETCGGDPQDLTVAKLIHYDVENAAPEYDIAESIETKDNQNFTVKIKPDYKFSDGTAVTAESFVKAWNYAAWGPNAYQANYFFEPFAGYGAMQCVPPENVELGEEEDPCAKYPPTDKDEALDGLKVVDETTFTIQTTEKVSNLEVRLGYTAFAPLPESFFEDPEAFGEKPVGAGPYQVDEWTKNEEIVLSKNPEYSGEFPGIEDKITFRIYENAEAAYADLQAGNLDVINQIPTDSLIDDKWLSDLDDRGTSRPVGVTQTIGINPVADKSLDNPDLRKAISMAIDRQTVIDQIFAGTREPATGWVSPVVDGFKAGACGEWCNYDPEAAKKLWDSAGGYDGALTLAVNNDSDHGPWAEAACNSIRQALDVECTVDLSRDFATFLTDLGEGKIKGMFRQGWQMDYPSIENFLVPLYSAGASSNYYGPYDNPEFEELTRKAAAAPDLDQANALYQQAEALLSEDMRIIPLWYATGQAGWSDRVQGEVAINAFGVPDYRNVELN
ncbi:ABC transporter substrate-binding protein [Nocardioides sp. BGMRC 2183]|nr:ABC transporter substrate-binding protein [Nocardioides sp. BGMRC 2183]